MDMPDITFESKNSTLPSNNLSEDGIGRSKRADSAVPIRFDKSSSDVIANSGKVFVQTVNPAHGKIEWKVQEENYDFIQEIARSAYADMLHDDERNELYYRGLRDAVSIVRSRGESVRVLDIGTGTGLLSMMAASCGADIVTACESFEPMAECAENIIKSNSHNDKITVFHKRSTRLKVGPGLDMEERANILVAELLDTELIGEGAIGAYAHAKEHLLTDNAVLVPSRARVYAQVVSSPLLQSYARPYISVPDDLKNIKMPASFEKCPGSISVHDIQMSQLPLDSFIPVSEPIVVFEFDWSGRTIPLTKKQTSSFKFAPFPASLEKKCHCVLMWWDVTMDQDGKEILTCAPFWRQDGDSGPNSVPWRDHWMQAVYHLPPPFPLAKKEEKLVLTAARDSYSMWFAVTEKEMSLPLLSPFCSCGLHVTTPRFRIGQLSHDTRIQLYRVAVSQALSERPAPTAWLLFGDSINLVIAGLLATSDKVSHVYIHISTSRGLQTLNEFIETNALEGTITLLPEDLSKVSSSLIKHEIGVVFSEPHFNTSLLPWHNIRTNFLLKESRHFLPQPTSKKASVDATSVEGKSRISSVAPVDVLTSALVLPAQMELYALPVSFLNLWKIRAPCHQRCGFDLKLFDELIEKARSKADDYVEAQPVWEYPCYALTAPIHLFSCDLSTDISQSNVAVNGSLPLDLHLLTKKAAEMTGHRKSVYGVRSNAESCPEENKGDGRQQLYYNGVVMWANWHFGGGKWVSTGPQGDVSPGKMVCWDMFSHQGVHLTRKITPLLYQKTSQLEFAFDVQLKFGDIYFSFDLQSAE